MAIEGANQVIVRFGVDGSLEEAVPPLDGDPFGDQAFYLGADGRAGSGQRSREHLGHRQRGVGGQVER